MLISFPRSMRRHEQRSLRSSLGRASVISTALLVGSGPVAALPERLSPQRDETPRTHQVSLTVRVTGFASTKGQLLLALHNSRDTFLSRKAPHRAATVAIGSDTVTYTFADLTPGKYSLAAFHDENANGDLDGVLRIPRERYGFSNNAHGRFGPPSYESTLFVLDVVPLTLDIRLRSAIER